MSKKEKPAKLSAIYEKYWTPAEHVQVYGRLPKKKHDLFKQIQQQVGMSMNEALNVAVDMFIEQFELHAPKALGGSRPDSGRK